MSEVRGRGYTPHLIDIRHIFHRQFLRPGRLYLKREPVRQSVST
jgi:hypothetical protein